MKILSMLAAAGLCASVSAQSALVCNLAPPVLRLGYNAPSNDTNVYFNLTVSSAITLQAIETPLLSATGQRGTLSLYTCPTTHVGNELNAAAWTLAATGVITSRYTLGGGVAAWTARSCQENATIPNTGLTLLPGSYGIAVRCQGVTPLLNHVAVLQTFSNPELSVSSGALQYTAFTSALEATVPGYAGWAFQGNILYQVGAGALHACAEPLPYGDGCYSRCGSFHQLFTEASPSTASVASAAMSGRRLTLDLVGSDYLVRQGTAAFLPPTAAAIVLPLGDDTEIPVVLPVPFPYPAGLAATFFVHANGYISVASNNILPGTMNWLPNAQSFLEAPAAGWWSWHDYNPTEPGSGQVTAEQVGTNLLVFTWTAVESDPVGTTNPSTFQFQFDVLTGQVNYVWQAIDAVGGSPFLQADDHLVGYSPGGASPNCGAVDITTLTAITLQEPEAPPLTLAASGRPLLGTTISLTTTNPTTPFGIGINFVATSRIPQPGLDLGVLGASGCRAHVDINTGVGNAIANTGLGGLTMSINLPVPNTPLLAGLEIFSQSVWLDAAQNAAGFITSNGLALSLGTL
jgi:hypothetical protein